MVFSRAIQRAIGLLRRNLQARAVVTTIALSTIALVVLGGFLSFGIGSGLYQTRVQQVLHESERAVIEVQNTFSASSAADEVALQSLINSVVPKLENDSTDQTRLVAMLRSPNQVSTQLLQSPISTNLDINVITQNIREKVQASTGKVVYQSIALTSGSATHPGLVVGAPIEIPLAGVYELYLVYDLNHEQQTLDLVQGTLVIGGLILLVIIGLVSLWVTSRIVQPVRLAARVSEKIAEGALDERIPEKGEDVIAQLARSFNAMADNLQNQLKQYEQISKMQQRFVSDVSHELRTPLTTIKLAGELIYDNRDDFVAPLKKSAEAMNSQIQRFETLLEDLLEISRYDAGAVAGDFELVNLVDVVKAAITGLEPLAANKGCEVILETPSDNIEAEIDSRRIERLLRNLIANALEHGEGKPVIISVGAGANAVAVSVTDQGVGMTRAQLDRVFDRFWRADPARKRTSGGTGLGLAISLEDANLHNGWLQVSAKPAEGSTFRLTLPRHIGAVFSQSPLPLPPKKKKVADETD
jgi:two-component system sensor histidine kinase MtrB